MINLDEFTVEEVSAGRKKSEKAELIVHADGKLQFTAKAQEDFGLAAGTNLAFLSKADADGQLSTCMILKGDKRGHIIKGNAEKKNASFSDGELAKKLIAAAAKEQDTNPDEVKRVNFPIIDQNELHKNLYKLDFDNSFLHFKD